MLKWCLFEMYCPLWVSGPTRPLKLDSPLVDDSATACSDDKCHFSFMIVVPSLPAHPALASVYPTSFFAGHSLWHCSWVSRGDRLDGLCFPEDAIKAQRALR